MNHQAPVMSTTIFEAEVIMRRLSVIAAVFAGSLLPVLGTTPAVGQIVGGALAAPDSRIETFSKTVDGDWRTVIKTADGREVEYVYVPPIKVDPDIRVDVRLAGSGDALRIVYDYRIGNGSGARQELAVLFFGSKQIMTVSNLPEGWQVMTPQRPGNVSLRGPLRGEVPAGIRPGERINGPTLEGMVLPGVVTVRAMGNTKGAVTVPEGLTAKQYDELNRISRVSTINRPAIGPAIVAGIGEPELTFDIVLLRVSSHYSSALTEHKHPYAADLSAALSRVAVAGASVDQQSVRDGLAKVKELSQRPVSERWHQELSTALGVCADALLSGALPVKWVPGVGALD